MSIMIKLDLPDSVAAEAKASRLLDPHKLTQWVQREIELDKPSMKNNNVQLVSIVRTPAPSNR
jgi:hypothetical protein